MSERKLEAVVVGPGAPGRLKVMFGRDSNKYMIDVPVEKIPLSLRHPKASSAAAEGTTYSDFTRITSDEDRSLEKCQITGERLTKLYRQVAG